MKKLTKETKELLINELISFFEKNKNGDFITTVEILRTFPAIKTGQNLRSIINKIRQMGYPIIASCSHSGGGYKLSDDIADIFAYSESLKNRILQMKKAYSGLFEWVMKNNIKINDFK